MAGVLDAVKALFNPPPGLEPAERALTFSQMFSTGADEAGWTSVSGERVDAESALEVIAVQAAIRLLANDIGSLPVDAYRSQDLGKKELRRPDFIVAPNPLNPNETWEDHVKQTVVGILSDGNAFTRCYPSVYQAQGVEAWAPGEVTIETRGANTIYRRSGDAQEYTPAEVIHIPWMRLPGKARGLNPIEYAKQGLGIGIAADKFVGAYFGNNAMASGWVEFPAGTDPTDAQIKQILDGINKKHRGAKNAFLMGALTGGAKVAQNAYNNRDAQLLELRDSIVEDVARLFGIPPHMLGSQKPGAVGYASVEQRSIDYVTHAVLPIVRRIESGYSRILRGQQTYLRFNLNGLLRGDAQSRAAFYSQMANIKVLRREEIRAFEDLPYDAEGVGYLETPNNNPPDAGPAQEPQGATE